MLGPIKLTDLTTAEIRAWHRKLTEHSGAYTANRANRITSRVLNTTAPPALRKFRFGS